jgi:iron uptake system component EfeO
MNSSRSIRNCLAALPLLVAAGCSSSPVEKTDADYQKEIADGMQASIAVEIDTWLAASKSLCEAAPSPQGRGWDAKLDADAITAMKAAWRKARTSYEHIEGAVAPLFPELDAATDARYDDFLSELGDKGDANLFDNQGVTGMHGVERILYADAIPAEVTAFEKPLLGYVVAAYPATEADAASFKGKLCEQLVTDITTLREQWKPAKLDIGAAYQGLISLMNEQHEKVNKASTGQEESRYSRLTLADIHANLQGTETIYALFQPWILSKDGGAAADKGISAGFKELHTAYDATPGDTIPTPPATWSATPSAEDMATPFGKLFEAVSVAVDPTREGSVVFEMNKAAGVVGLPGFKGSK